MALETKAVLEQIDAVLSKATTLGMTEVAGAVHEDEYGNQSVSHHWEKNTEDVSRGNVLIASALRRYAPPGSPHVAQAEAILKQYGPANEYAHEQLVGVLRALRFEYESGLLASVVELVHADLFADFLEMARHLLEKGFKDPAAVLASGVFEQHLRRLAEKNGVPLAKTNGEPKSAEAINVDLQKVGAYDIGTQKNVTANLALRNSAAHGEWGKYEQGQVTLLIDWVQFLMGKYPA